MPEPQGYTVQFAQEQARRAAALMGILRDKGIDFSLTPQLKSDDPIKIRFTADEATYALIRDEMRKRFPPNPSNQNAADVDNGGPAGQRGPGQAPNTNSATAAPNEQFYHRANNAAKGMASNGQPGFLGRVEGSNFNLTVDGNRDFLQFTRSGSTEQPTGWKFHLSVNPADVPRATQIVREVYEKYGLSVFKVTTPQTTAEFNSPGNRQAGKMFTLYDQGEGTNKWRAALQEIEQKFNAAGIQGSQPVAGDRPVAGSQYAYYRNDGDFAGGRYVSAEETNRLPPEQRYNPLGVRDPYQGFDARMATGAASTATNTGNVQDDARIIADQPWQSMNSPANGGNVIRADASALNAQQRNDLLSALKRQGIDAQVVHSNTFNRDYIQVGSANKNDISRLTNIVTQHDSQLIGSQTWQHVDSPASGGEVLRVDASNLNPQQRQNLLDALQRQGIAGEVGRSRTFGNDYIQVRNADFGRLGEVLEHAAPAAGIGARVGAAAEAVGGFFRKFGKVARAAGVAGAAVTVGVAATTAVAQAAEGNYRGAASTLAEGAIGATLPIPSGDANVALQAELQKGLGSKANFGGLTTAGFGQNAAEQKLAQQVTSLQTAMNAPYANPDQFRQRMNQLHQVTGGLANYLDPKMAGHANPADAEKYAKALGYDNLQACLQDLRRVETLTAPVGGAEAQAYGVPTSAVIDEYRRRVAGQPQPVASANATQATPPSPVAPAPASAPSTPQGQTPTASAPPAGDQPQAAAAQPSPAQPTPSPRADSKPPPRTAMQSPPPAPPQTTGAPPPPSTRPASPRYAAAATPG